MELGKFGILGCGFLLGTAGVKILSSDDAKKVYTHVTASVMRGCDEVTKTYHVLKENCQDIAEDAKEINLTRLKAKEEKRIEDAKALLAAYEEPEKA